MVIENIIKETKKNKFSAGLYDLFEDLIDEGFDTVLDVGCGKGPWSYIGAKKRKFKNIYACDVFDDFQTEEIGKLAESVTYRQVENDLLPFAENSFDLVFSMDVIEHVADDLNFISEKIRVAKPGGKIIIGTPNYYRIGNLPLIFSGRLKYPRILGRDSYGDVLYLREYKKADLIKLLEQFNDKIDRKSVKITPCYLGVPMLEMGVRKVPLILESFCQYWLVELIKN